MTVQVFLGDLRYNYAGILANDCMPLGVAYMKAVMDRDNPDVQSRIFVYPDRLIEALRDSPPDVLMLSNYVWNEALSREFFRIAKRLNPDVITVMGGPNIPLEVDRQAAYVERHPEIDIYLLGRRRFSGEHLASSPRRCRLVDQTLRRPGARLHGLPESRGPGHRQSHPSPAP